MRFFWTLVWTFLLIHMLTYVATSMIGSGYDFNTATILAIAAAILIFLITAVLPETPAKEQ